MADHNTSTKTYDERQDTDAVPPTPHEAIAYQFNTDHVRTVRIGDTVWFAAPDVCSILGLENVSQALSRLLPEERSFADLFSSGQIRQTAMVDESGLIALILSSRKPDAITFRRWITKEVLPSIWKTGSYTSPNTDPAIEHSDIADIINRRTGMYVVVVEDGQRRMWETDGTEIINVAIQGLSTMMAGCLIAAQGALIITQPETLLRDVDTRYALDSLGGNIDRGAELARRYLTVNRFHTTESEMPPGEVAH